MNRDFKKSELQGRARRDFLIGILKGVVGVIPKVYTCRDRPILGCWLGAETTKTPQKTAFIDIFI